MFKKKNIINHRKFKKIILSSQNLIKYQSFSKKEISIYLKIILNKYKKNIFSDEMLILSDVINFEKNITGVSKNFNILKNLTSNLHLFDDIKINEEKIANISCMFIELNNCFGTENALKVIDNISYRSLQCKQN